MKISQILNKLRKSSDLQELWVGVRVSLFTYGLGFFVPWACWFIYQHFNQIIPGWLFVILLILGPPILVVLVISFFESVISYLDPESFGPENPKDSDLGGWEFRKP